MIEQAVVHEHRKIKGTSIVRIHVVPIKILAVLVKVIKQFAEGVASRQRPSGDMSKQEQNISCRLPCDAI